MGKAHQRDAVDLENGQMLRTGALVLLAQMLLVGISADSGGTLFNGAAVVWALAWLSVGAVPGFLFGIPKVVQRDVASAGEAAAPYTQRVNTNLEQVSDWLTKLLIGVGLVELANLRTGIVAAADHVATSIRETPSFASALIILFAVQGFGAGYLATRLFLPRAFRRADLDGISRAHAEAVASVPAALPDADAPVPESAAAAADEIARRSFAELRAFEVLPWAQAQRIRGNVADALRAARAAVQFNARDPRARLELGIALYHARSLHESYAELVVARDQVLASGDRQLAATVYGWLTFVCLWIDPPKGFTEAIRFGEEFLEKKLPLGDGAVLVNLAAGYGQRAGAIAAAAPPDPAAAGQVRTRALEVFRLAAGFDKGRWKERLRELLIKDLPGKNPADDDLEVFDSDPAFRAALAA